MAPVSFNDLAKTAKDVLDNDFTTGYQFKAKQKTSCNNAVSTTAVDVSPGAKEFTAGKLTWKIPNPAGIKGFSIDKLEMDKAGKYKVEASFDKAMHSVDALKIDVKSDLKSFDKVSACFTYTALKDIRLQAEAPVVAPEAFVAEATRELGQATVGAKCSLKSIQKPDLGARFVQGPFFGAVLATNQFKTFSGYCFWNACSVFKVAATCEKSEKGGKGSIACQYAAAKTTTIKAKVTDEQVVFATVKHDLTKGFTVNCGGKYELKTGKYGLGLQLSVE
eukprot:TRINITY_DN74645_c0_g1_i1.p1 TRINITY_DN74645_c0_g1~~TRINITY_DN74645_c0_g1_i1.p1  ORF type:complete len:277 (-),score=116.47 TRINITY_DN74645_c0_g1_i1:250-1080(-)